MITSTTLLPHVKCVEEAVTYLQDESRVVGRIDLGSADLSIVKDDTDSAMIVILTSSGHAACLPVAELLALV